MLVFDNTKIYQTRQRKTEEGGFAEPFIFFRAEPGKIYNIRHLFCSLAIYRVFNLNMRFCL
jgi:hypothetical protein